MSRQTAIIATIVVGTLMIIAARQGVTMKTPEPGLLLGVVVLGFIWSRYKRWLAWSTVTGILSYVGLLLAMVHGIVLLPDGWHVATLAYITTFAVLAAAPFVLVLVLIPTAIIRYFKMRNSKPDLQRIMESMD